MTQKKKKYGKESSVGKAPTRKCMFEENCEPVMLDALDPFTKETFTQLVCKHCGKPY